MSFPASVIAAFAVVLVTAGCGGGGASTSSARTASVSLDSVIKCVRQTVDSGRVSTASRDLDQIAQRATKGAAVVRFDVSSIAPKGLNIATIVLERSSTMAEATAAHYRGVYKALGGNPQALLSRTANAVVAFGAKPSRGQRAAIRRCVRPS